jgi:CDP-Glycerol:Poly(glycerophosphate) glycerophosphotransferase
MVSGAVLTASAAGHRSCSLLGVAETSLLNDTALRRTRRAAADFAHAFDDLICGVFRRRSVHLLFEAASPLSLAVFRPVLEQLQQDCRLEMWYTTADRTWDAQSVFGDELAPRVLSQRDLRWMKFDAYLNTDFWNMTWLRRRSRRIHLFHGVAGKYSLDCPVSIAPVVASFDELLFPNADRLMRYVDAGLIDPRRTKASLVGYPKVDCLIDGSLDRAAIAAATGLNPSAPTVLYAPTWSQYSALHTAGLDLLPKLASLGLNVIVKLHDRSFDASRDLQGIDWRSRLDTVARTPNIHVVRGADVSPYLFVSDLVVTDHSSVGFEFMLLDRPVVVIDCPELIEKASVNREKVALLRSAADVVIPGADIPRVVTQALARPKRLSAQRRVVAERLFYQPGGATARAVRCVYETLGIPAPEPTRQVAPPASGRLPLDICEMRSASRV